MFPQLIRQVLVPLSKLPERSLHIISRLVVRDKCTVPFLVRYRQREMIDPPSEVTAPVLFELQKELEKWTALVKLRKSRLATLAKSDQPLETAVISRLEQCLTRAELDEAYEGVKPAARTSKVEAAKAIEGLESVAKLLLNERVGHHASKIDTQGVSELLKRHKLRRDEATFHSHLQNYLVDHVAHSASSVASAKNLLLHRVRVTAAEAKATSSSKETSAAAAAAASEKLKGGAGKSKSKSTVQNNNTNQKYRDYFQFDRMLRGVPSHQVGNIMESFNSVKHHLIVKRLFYHVYSVLIPLSMQRNHLFYYTTGAGASSRKRCRSAESVSGCGRESHGGAAESAEVPVSG
jgi:hypothetical protein